MNPGSREWTGCRAPRRAPRLLPLLAWGAVWAGSGIALAAPGVSITQSGGSTNVNEEGPTSDTYTVVLDELPAAVVEVVINLDAQVDVGAGGGSPILLTFTPGDWSISQTVTVTAVDDSTVEGAHASTISHTASSSDAGYDGIAIADVVVAITDNDSAGVTITESGGFTEVSENGPTADSYEIVLDSRPTATVTITVSCDAQVDLGLGPGAPVSVVIGASSWSLPRYVFVTAVDDGGSEGNHTSTITHSAVSADPDYDGIAIGDVVVTVIDNDAPGVKITQSGGSTAVQEEGSTTDTYTIELLRAPTAAVTITIDPDQETDLGAGPGTAIDLVFTVVNWNIVRQVNVSAVDDAESEGPHTSTITHSASSTDPAYDGIAIANVVANVTDNDVVGVTIAESGGSTDVDEAGPTSDTYTIVLDSQPAADVIITVDPDGQTDVGSGPGVAINLTFTAGNWFTPRTVTVTAVDDAIGEGNHTSTITHSASSADVAYDGVVIADLVANISDNETTGVSITESGGSTAVSEAGPTSDTYTIVLDSQPTGQVTITVDPDIQTSVGSGPGTAINLVFTAANWDAPRVVTVTAVDDDIQEGAHSSTITHTASSSDPDYDGFVIADVVADVTDNDSAGISIAESGGSTDVDEAGPTSDAYTIVLDSQPTADVTVTADPDGQTDLGAGPGVAVNRVFTGANWDTPQSVTVTAVDDFIAEGVHASTILHLASSADLNYDGIATAEVVADITDNDAAGVTIAESGGSTDVDEAGPTSDTYTIVLDSQPTGDVIISVDPDDQSDLGSGPGIAINLTFTGANWDAPQVVTAAAVDDAVDEGAHASTITHTASSTDPKYDGLPIADVVANVTDDDAAGVTITESGGSTSVNEAGPTSDTYTVVLDSQPAADVAITVDPDGQTDLGAGQGIAINLTFTGADWDTPQVVTVTAIDDAVDEGAHTSIITHTASSGDPGFDGIAIANVVAHIIDDDVAGVTIAESDGSTDVSETGPTADTYTLVLDAQPTADVTVTVDPDGQSDLGAGPGTAINLTFTGANWDVPQSVTVTAVDDAIEEGAHTSTITHAASSADLGYDGIAIANVVASVGDNDTPGVTVTESGGSTSVSETGPTSDSYTIVLDSEPIANVTITVDPDGQANLGAGPGSPINLTFTAGNWTVPQVVTVTAVDDHVDEGAHTSTITHTAGSGDPNYNGSAIANVVADVIDDDTAGVTIAESGGSTRVSEIGPTSDTYTIVLDSQPTADVTVTVDPDGQTDLGAGPGVGVSLTYTMANWNVVRTIFVTAVDDAAPEGPHVSTITHAASSGDPNYEGMAIADVIVNVTDNDVPGVTIAETGGSTDVDETGPTSDSYSIALDSQPTDDVVVTIAPDGQIDLGAGAGVAVNLTFTDANWNTPQVVTVTAVDDDVDEGGHTSTITHAASSTDLDYDGIAIGDVVADVTDNDIAGIAVTESGGSTDVDEDGPTSDTYAIVLDSQPTADVTVNVDPDGQTDLGAGAGVAIVLTFTAADWDAPRTVTVTAVDDAIDEGVHASTILHAASSGDLNYDGIATADVIANIADNDVAGVTIAESGGSTDVDETGPTSDTYAIVLDSQPTANVIIAVDPDGQTDLGAGAGVAVNLTFTAANWNAPRTVTVTAVDDAVDDGAHTSIITHAASSGDPVYDGLAIADVVASVTENDVAGITITESGGSTNVDETGPTSDTFDVVLDSEPTANVTIAIDPDGQTDVGAGPGAAINLVFTSANWDSHRTVVVTAVDDAALEGPHTSVITHAVGSLDANYDGMAIADLIAQVGDNDLPGVSLSESSGSTSVSEQGPTSDTYAIILTAPPLARVDITVTPDMQTQVGAGAGTPITLAFNVGDWSIPRTVVVTAAEDTVPEGPHISTITHAASSADPDYDGIAIANVVAQVVDNDAAEITLIESGGSTRLDEAGPTSDTYTIVLGSQPADDVFVTVDADGQVDLGGGPGGMILLTFTDVDWDVAQVVTVTAVDDDFDQGAHSSTITHTVGSNDLNYDAIAIADVVAAITDDDVAGITITESGGSTGVDEEGPTSDTYDIVLDSHPMNEVSIAVIPDDQTDLGAGPGIAIDLSSTGANWDSPQVVTVTAVDDDVDEGAHSSTIRHAAVSDDFNYDGMAIADVVAGVADNDAAGVAIAESDGATGVDETGPTSDTYAIMLESQPVADVVITVHPDEQTDLGAGPGAPIDLIFTVEEWAAARVVTLTAVDDAVDEGAHISTITHEARSGDPNYDGMAIAEVVADVADNDIAGVTIAESGGSTSVSETGPTSDMYTIVLNSRPTADVTITVTPDGQTDLGAGPGAAIELTFTGANWEFFQVVTVTAVDDDAREGARSSRITHHAESADDAYDGLALPDIAVVVLDNDAESGDPTDPGDPPIADAGPDLEGLAGQVIMLDGSKSRTANGSEIVDYFWDLGGGGADGKYARGMVVECVFDAPGEYTILLRVRDDRGESAEDTTIVQVLPNPPMAPLACGTMCGALGLANIPLAIAPLIAIGAARIRRFRRRS